MSTGCSVRSSRALSPSSPVLLFAAYRTKLLSVVLLAVGFSVALGWLLARRGLAPVRLSAEDTGDDVVISVADNGPGIAPEHLPFLFDRFYRADAARSSADSTGLGLALVRSIAELHGGDVSVHSKLGKGATFVLRFPKAYVA